MKRLTKTTAIAAAAALVGTYALSDDALRNQAKIGNDVFAQSTTSDTEGDQTEGSAGTQSGDATEDSADDGSGGAGEATSPEPTANPQTGGDLTNQGSEPAETEEKKK